MTKPEFMKELESLLLDIPLEEREEALQYYNGYFEDAGEDHEEEIMKELGSPKRVASIIKADLNSNDTDRENRGYFTETGYQDNLYKEEKYELVGSVTKESAEKEEQESKGSTNNTNRDYNNSRFHHNNTNTSQGAYNNQNTNQSAYQKAQQTDRNTKIALIVLLCIFGFPIIVGVAGAIFGLLIGVIGALGGIVIGFGAAGIAMIGAGIALFITGLLQFSVPFMGFLLCGSGLLVFGLGMLFILLTVVICKKVIPVIITGIVNLCKMPFKNRSVTA